MKLCTLGLISTAISRQVANVGDRDKGSPLAECQQDPPHARMIAKCAHVALRVSTDFESSCCAKNFSARPVASFVALALAGLL